MSGYSPAEINTLAKMRCGRRHDRSVRPCSECFDFIYENQPKVENIPPERGDSAESEEVAALRVQVQLLADQVEKVKFSCSEITSATTERFKQVENSLGYNTRSNRDTWEEVKKLKAKESYWAGQVVDFKARRNELESLSKNTLHFEGEPLSRRIKEIDHQLSQNRIFRDQANDRLETLEGIANKPVWGVGILGILEKREKKLAYERARALYRDAMGLPQDEPKKPAESDDGRRCGNCHYQDEPVSHPKCTNCHPIWPRPNWEPKKPAGCGVIWVSQPEDKTKLPYAPEQVVRFQRACGKNTSDWLCPNCEVK